LVAAARRSRGAGRVASTTAAWAWSRAALHGARRARMIESRPVAGMDVSRFMVTFPFSTILVVRKKRTLSAVVSVASSRRPRRRLGHRGSREGRPGQPRVLERSGGKQWVQNLVSHGHSLCCDCSRYSHSGVKSGVGEETDLPAGWLTQVGPSVRSDRAPTAPD
jgi:hypothetical protein